MKKAISFVLAALMLVSAVPTAMATNDYTQGTQVVYQSSGSEAYTITVPALLSPGESGTVTLSGTWAENRIVTVTADPTVTLKNSIKETDTKTLNVNFDGISEAGSNTGSQTFTESVSVDNITNALFGTWSGKFNYNVEMTNVVAAESPIVYNAWYRNTDANNGESIMFIDEDTMFLEWNNVKLQSGQDGAFTVDGNQMVSAGEVVGNISADGQKITTSDGSEYILDTTTRNTQLTYFHYLNTSMHAAFTPGMTWEEFCDDLNFLWLVNDDGFVYDYDHGLENLYPVMYEDRSPVKGTDLIVANTLYICDKP